MMLEQIQMPLLAPWKRGEKGRGRGRAENLSSIQTNLRTQVVSLVRCFEQHLYMLGKRSVNHCSIHGLPVIQGRQWHCFSEVTSSTSLSLPKRPFCLPRCRAGHLSYAYACSYRASQNLKCQQSKLYKAERRADISECILMKRTKSEGGKIMRSSFWRARQMSPSSKPLLLQREDTAEV